MAIADDFTITYGVTKTVEHTSGTTVYTVLEFFQYLAAEFAASAQMDDDYAFVSDTPTVYRWVNDWAFGAPTTDYKFLSGGAIESSDGDELWSNVYHIGSLEEGSKIYIIQNDTELSSTGHWEEGSIDILLLVKTGGADIDSGNVTCMVRETDYSYDHNTVDLSGGGRNPVGLNNAIDINYRNVAGVGDIYIPVIAADAYTAGNYVLGASDSATARINYVDAANDYLYLVMVEGTFNASEVVDEGLARGLTNGTGASSTNGAQVDVVADLVNEITVDFSSAPYSKDLNNGNGATNYDATVVATGETVLDVYQHLKYITRRGSTESTDGDDGQEYLEASGAGTYTAVKAAPFGTFAGGTFFGARGIWLEGVAVDSYSLFNSANAQQNPPDYQKVTVSHTNLSGCQIFVAEISAGDFVKDQYTVSAADGTTLTATASIDINKTPQSGTFRMADDTVYTYTSFSAAIFSGVTPDPTGETGDFYVPLMDRLADETPEQSANIIYSAPVTVRTVVRKYGYKPYTADTSFGANGLTFSPILATDPQAT